MTATSPVLIIGGGIAGPALAMALQKAGIEAVIYEAHQNTADGVGTFLTLASNGIDALRTIDIDASAIRDSFPTPNIGLRGASGKFLGQTSTGKTSPPSDVSRTIRRSDLYAAMREQAVSRRILTEHGKRLTDVKETDRDVTAIFEDGTTATSSALVGCDGVHSAVRSLIDPGAPQPKFAGLLNTSGYATGAEVTIAPGTYEMIFGKQAFFGYTVATSNDVWWFANIPEANEPRRNERIDPSGHALRQHLLELFRDDSGPAVRLINATQEITPLIPIHSVPHLPSWHSDRMVVIGDAAHAPTPSSGQGASLSVEDGVLLAKCLRDSPSPADAFRAFEQQRRRHVEHIIKWAARMNNSKAAGPVGAAIRDAIMPVIIKMTANNKAQQRLFDHHIDW